MILNALNVNIQFKIDESAYAEISRQVRNQHFKIELDKKLDSFNKTKAQDFNLYF